MSRKSRRAGRQQGRQIAYAATTRTLGQVPARHRKLDRPTHNPAPSFAGWTADIALMLADATTPDVPRSELRAAMPHGDSLQRSSGAANQQSTQGRRGSKKLQDLLAKWERSGWIHRNDNDTVTVLDRDALRERADQEETP